MLSTFRWSALLFAALFIGLSPTLAREVPREVAIRVIVGEAADQDMHGMICVGEVLRKRGSIKGFAGYWSDHIKDELESTWKKAAIAWDTSARTHYTKGADHFYDKRRSFVPSWGGDFVKTYEYRNHVFLKEVKRSGR